MGITVAKLREFLNNLPPEMSNIPIGNVFGEMNEKVSALRSAKVEKCKRKCKNIYRRTKEGKNILVLRF